MSASNNGTVAGPTSHEVEVMAKATRRRFTAEYKLKILREAEACTRPGEIGALLRQEGLYFSNLRTWRGQLRRVGELGLAPKKRGPAPTPTNPLATKVAALEREVARQKARADRAEALVELQKKVAAFLESEQTRKSGKG
jgi:transposase